MSDINQDDSTTIVFDPQTKDSGTDGFEDLDISKIAGGAKRLIQE